MSTKEQLFYVIAGTIAWFAIRGFSPKIAGAILFALVIGAIVSMGAQLNTLGRTGATGSW